MFQIWNVLRGVFRLDMSVIRLTMTACFLSVHLNVIVSLKENALGSKRHQDLY